MGPTRARQPSKRTLKAEAKPEAAGKQAACEKLDAGALVPTVTARNSQSSLHSLILVPTAEVTINATYDPHCIVVQDTPKKGKGLVAAHRIPQGSLVLAEEPIIRLTSTDEREESGIEELLQSQFRGLSKATSKEYLHLHDAKKSNFSRVKSIYFSNCYNLATPRSLDGGSCIGLSASRINHSCIPNVQFSFHEQARIVIPQPHATHSDDFVNISIDGPHSFRNPGKGLMLFHALRTIKPGEEIVSNYESSYMLREERQDSQQHHYGFKCDCKACDIGSANAHWAKSDARRTEMITIRRIVNDANHERGHVVIPSIMNSLEKLVKLLKDEGSKALELANVYKQLAKWSEKYGDQKTLKYWLKEERALCVIAFGKYGRRVQGIEKQLQAIGG